MTLSQVLLGLATGIPVMIVVGPVSLLLIEQGMKHGFRGGMPAAVGVGATDLTFSVAAAVTGAAAARVLEPAQAVLHFLAFGVLAWLAAVTWRAARRDLLHLDGQVTDGQVTDGQVTDDRITPATHIYTYHRTTTPSSGEAVTALQVALHPVPVSPTTMGPPASSPTLALDGAHDASGSDPVSAVVSGSGARAVLRVVLGGDSWLARAAAFFAITAANPITIVVFASLVVSGREGIGSPGWVLGMTVASVLVSTVYLAVGHGLGAVLSESATARLRMGGAVVILGLGAWFALTG